ncbi:poly [ADP-ribose] polymerase tankyrase-1-like isoform X2 [Mercenaria mercenaria]|uniref:poly [ADP-ribose] polymerase tankyrase-1-like isoform X2 n=1 Tax=Mercenaria mercenaria TaxID=6596 RepID=UPI00234E6DD0|nr:poly [ADP-ribose] polymerase tankyrase-1-like isoform X2 [Mercenaria mercenaria]
MLGLRWKTKQHYGDTGVDVTTDARVLFDAVRHGKNHLVRFILDASSVDIVNSRDLHGKTPLMACCYTKEEGARDNTVRLLLRHGADVNATDDCGRTALSYVCERRCNDILRILIKEHNVDPDITDTNGNTPLIYSAMVGNDIACDILIRHFRRLGLNIEAINDEGFTALLMAAKHGNITCAQILVGQGKASTQHRDIKYGLSVEEWLAKKGFTLQDIKPVRQDGRGRSRFVKLANIAAICSAPKKHAQAAPTYGEIDYHLNRFQLGKIEDDDDLTDATTGTDISNESISRYLNRYNDRYNDIDLDFAQKHYKIYPYRENSRPKLKTSSTQTQTDEADDTEGDKHDVIENDDADEKATLITVADTANCDAETEITILQHDPRIHLEQRLKNKFTNKSKSSEGKSKTRSMEKIQEKGNKESKRLSLPEIEHTPMVSRCDSGNGERKQSLDVLPEKLIASIELGDGRRQSIQLHADSIRNKVYWSPVGDERSDDGSEKNLMPLKFERNRGSVSDSETSMNEDGPIFQ